MSEMFLPIISFSVFNHVWQVKILFGFGGKMPENDYVTNENKISHQSCLSLILSYKFYIILLLLCLPFLFLYVCYFE